MSDFYKETDGIYRLKVPFDTVYTSVFLILSGENVILVDCATTPEDVNCHIIPALERLGYTLRDITALILTHNHDDHAGGLHTVLQHAPHIRVITDVCQVADELYTYPLPGHTADAIGVLDMRTGTLISGDGLQGAGVDKYRCYTQLPNAYLKTIDRLKHDERIKSILFSHAYEPWYKDVARNRDEVERCLCDCLQYINI